LKAVWRRRKVNLGVLDRLAGLLFLSIFCGITWGVLHIEQFALRFCMGISRPLYDGHNVPHLQLSYVIFPFKYGEPNV
jgi:hypothetical protein